MAQKPPRRPDLLEAPLERFAGAFDGGCWKALLVENSVVCTGTWNAMFLESQMVPGRVWVEI